MPYLSSEFSLHFPQTKNCLDLEIQINKLVNNTAYWREQFNESEANASKLLSEKKKKQSQDQNCAKVIAGERGNVISSIADKYKEVDKIRIQTESIQKRNKQIIFGGAVLLIGLGLIISFKNKK